MSTRKYKAISFLKTALLGAAILFHGSCAKKEVFPEIGTSIASPIDVVSSPDQELFYILNADMDRTYNKGSILVIDNDGEKITSIETPRLGRSLTIVDKILIATFDDPGFEEGEDPKIHLYDIEDSKNPILLKSFKIDCSPLNAVGRQGYRYFAVACQGGILFIGDLANKTLKKVRDQNYNRRALYIDSKRNLLFAFVTDLGKVDLSDQVLTDTASWDDSFNKTDGKNEVPDQFESTARARRQEKTRQKKFQYIVYDIEKESKEVDEDGENFPFRAADTDQAKSEFRWFYFNLANFDGTPDSPSGYTDDTTKYYRTNFWEAKPDLEDPNVFYLSHRGLGTSESSPDSNSVIKVSITGTIRANSEGKIPQTKDFFDIERIYGFSGTQNSSDKPSYTGDFELMYSGGEKAIIVNNFRDLANFRAYGGPRFTISAATLDEGIWFAEKESTNGFDGFYQIALGKNDRIATCSFYGNAVMLLEVKTGAAITEIKRLN